MTAHTTIQPSSSSIWIECAGSIVAQMLYPEDDDKMTTKEGKLAHFIASEILNSFASGSSGILMPSNFKNFMSEDGLIADDEMLGAVDVYITDILTICQQNKIGYSRLIEFFVMIPSIHQECGGTIDCFAIDMVTKTIYVWDFKYGYKFVDVYANTQLIAYLRGILDHYGLNDLEFNVVFTIVQPRCYQSDTIRRWSVKAVDLRPYVNKLHYAAHKAMEPTPPVKTGVHCTNCTARHSCKAAINATTTIVDFESTLDLASFTNLQLSCEIDIAEKLLKMIEARFESLNELATIRARNGQIIPGRVMTQTVGNLSWNKTDKEIIDFVKLVYGTDISKPATPHTPKQIIDKKLLSEKVVLQLASRQKTGVKLKKADPNEVSKVFNQN